MEHNKYNKTLLKPPAGATVTETAIADFWMEKDGTICTVAKKVRRSMENLVEYIEALKNRVKNKKIYYLVDLTNVQTYSREEKDFIYAQLKAIAKAIAVVSSSPVGKMMSQVLFMKQGPEFPVKQFDSVEEAHKWLNGLKQEEMRG